MPPPYMNDSSDEDVSVTNLCSIDPSGIIHSVSSNDFPIRFSIDSFVINCIDNILMFYMHPMFIWRLIFANTNISDNEKEFNFHKLKIFVIRLEPEIYITNKDIEYKVDGIINRKPSKKLFDIMYVSYSRLYMSIQRGYNQNDVVKHLLDNYILLLRYISES
jgi:hypothetical protein